MDFRNEATKATESGNPPFIRCLCLTQPCSLVDTGPHGECTLTAQPIILLVNAFVPNDPKTCSSKAAIAGPSRNWPELRRAMLICCRFFVSFVGFASSFLKSVFFVYSVVSSHIHMRTYRYLHLDVFTDTPLEGNQLAVFPEPAGLSTDDMQRITREMAFSECTFVFPPETPGTHIRLRIFTPGEELPMAGHPTIGTTFALGAGRRDRQGRAGARLRARRGPDARGDRVDGCVAGLRVDDAADADVRPACHRPCGSRLRARRARHRPRGHLILRKWSRAASRFSSCRSPRAPPWMPWMCRAPRIAPA